MPDLLTASITIFGGFVVFVLGQVVLKFFIEPIHEQSRTIGEIAHSLIFMQICILILGMTGWRKGRKQRKRCGHKQAY